MFSGTDGDVCVVCMKMSVGFDSMFVFTRKVFVKLFILFKNTMCYTTNTTSMTEIIFVDNTLEMLHHSETEIE